MDHTLSIPQSRTTQATGTAVPQIITPAVVEGVKGLNFADFLEMKTTSVVASEVVVDDVENTLEGMGDGENRGEESLDIDGPEIDKFQMLIEKKESTTPILKSDQEMQGADPASHFIMAGQFKALTFYDGHTTASYISANKEEVGNQTKVQSQTANNTPKPIISNEKQYAATGMLSESSVESKPQPTVNTATPKLPAYKSPLELEFLSQQNLIPIEQPQKRGLLSSQSNFHSGERLPLLDQTTMNTSGDISVPHLDQNSDVDSAVPKTTVASAFTSDDTAEHMVPKSTVTSAFTSDDTAEYIAPKSKLDIITNNAREITPAHTQLETQSTANAPTQLNIPLLQSIETKVTAKARSETLDVVETFLESKSALQSQSTTLTASHRSEFHAPISRQIIHAVHARITTNHIIEVSLSPVELGRLKMSISPTDNGVSINILAERSDTIDLVRRNIQDLEKAFTEMGYDEISFSFEQNEAFSHQDDPHDSPQSEDATEWAELKMEAPEIEAPETNLNPTNGIDIRV